MMNVAEGKLTRKIMVAALMAVSFAFADGNQYQYMLVEPTVVDTSVATPSPATAVDSIVSRASSSVMSGDVGFDSLVRTIERSAALDSKFYRSPSTGVVIIVR